MKTLKSRIGIFAPVRLPALADAALHIALLLAVAAAAAFSLSACHVMDNETDQSARGKQFLKEKKYAEAESVFKEIITSKESKLAETKAKEASATGAVLVLLKNEEKDRGKQLAVAYNNLATVLYDSGRYGEAESAFEKAINTYRQYFGKQHHFVIDCLSSLSAGYYKQGKYLDAERYYLEELELEKKLLKPDSLSIALTANNLAAIYQKLGDDDEAEKYMQWALNLCRNSKPSEKEKDQLIDLLNNLAVFYEKSGKYDSAREMVNRALALENKQTETLFLVDRVRTLLVLASLDRTADLDLDASEQHYQEALTLIDSSLGGRSDLAGEAQEKYADLLLSERKFTEAEPAFDRSLKACIEARGEEHPSVAEHLFEFSLLMRRLKRYPEAESMLRRALAIQEKTIGVDTTAYLATLHRLASVLDEQKRTAEADSLYSSVMPKLKERLGPLHPFVADTMDNWAVYVEKCHGKEDAEELRANARVIRRKIAHSLKPVYSQDQH